MMISVTVPSPLYTFYPRSHQARVKHRSPPVDYRRFDLMATLGSRQLPMPNVTRLISLSQAHATLQHCCTKLSSFVQEYSTSATTTSPSESPPLSEEWRQFQLWLEQWEVAFTTFLTNAMATMNSGDIAQSRILKANHLACTILAAGIDSSSTFETECSAIIGLAGAVLRSNDDPATPESTRPLFDGNNLQATKDLHVLDPLMVVISRCGKDTVRTQAAALLRLTPR